ncbi:hypothetical protein ASPNIDRAFT_43571 [Aspergillus niger ATCC 1015]|uniref:Contig An09c0020, genomic contig n=4 Tax=Aspergillus niger TaxID=5061 RepID=A2QSZ6_ASPNC|nr:uncharacterized protein BO96DRAFT_400807 [Aspergillus niger CBS 101883]XP_059601292.1 uncharacterized protein An09g00230 [Aspergillus niger]EHA28112.1 hypothetical protein ASPNIDRAFT_43571 [Aspergillus niger ATCC 1015]RDH14940.1 hypothetical protein M747DRAFT_326476 [Aspergillus niger ATCC 13496]PYH52877.1 hypothetical protein BO96DRAFT_400807 [Aspergillus niger CBS 101883]CAK40111.1 unnamed protein product [Aspergillus niger]
MDRANLFKNLCLWMTVQRHYQSTLMDMFSIDRLTCGRNDPTNKPHLDVDPDGGHKQAPPITGSRSPMRYPSLYMGSQLDAWQRIILVILLEVPAHVIPPSAWTRCSLTFGPRSQSRPRGSITCGICLTAARKSNVYLSRSLREVIAPEGLSSLMIDKMISPEMGKPTMVCLAVMERTRIKWNKLLRAAGLPLIEPFTYAIDLCQGDRVVERLNADG